MQGKWVWVEGGEHRLMEALYTKGPMMVRFNTMQEFKINCFGIFHCADMAC